MAGGMAALVDMWKLAGTGGTPRCTVKSEAHRPGGKGQHSGSRCGCGRGWSR